MPRDLLNSLSPNELKKEIDSHVCLDNRALPTKSKIFAAVAKIQKFDQLPELQPVGVFDALIKAGGTELNRGFSGQKGIPSFFFVKELVHGSLYPGTLSAFGNGIYFSTCSKPGPIQEFPKVSGTALRYTKGEGAGTVVRAVLKRGINCIKYDELKATFYDFKNRAKQAGVSDMGALAASLGFEVIICDNSQLYDGEDTYVVLNRAVLTIQKTALKIEEVNVDS